MTTQLASFQRAKARLAHAQQDALHDTCQIVTVVPTFSSGGLPVRNAVGEGVTDSTAISLPVACAFRSLHADESVRAETWVAHGTALIKVPFGTAIAASSRVLYNGSTYEVAGIRPPSQDQLSLWVSLTLTAPGA